MLALDARDLVEHRRQGAARHRDVLDERRAERLHRGMHRPADREQPLALVAVVRDRDGAAGAPRAPRRSRPPRRAAAGPSVWIVSCAAPGVGGSSDSRAWTAAEGRGIHQLHDRRLHARGGHGGGCLGGRAHVREGRGDRAHLAGDEPAELQRRADDDAERALRADHERREVEPRHALDGAVAEAEQPAVGEHEVDAEHGVAHDSVLRAQQPAGAGGDVAADRRDRAARRIGRPPQAVLGERGVEVARSGCRARRPRAGRRGAPRGCGPSPRIDSAISPVAGVRAAGEAGAGAARHDGRAGLGRDAQRRLHVVDRDRVDDGERGAGCRVPRLVGAGGLQRGRRRVDAIAECGAQPRDDVGRPLTRTGGGRRSRRP